MTRPRGRGRSDLSRRSARQNLSAIDRRRRRRVHRQPHAPPDDFPIPDELPSLGQTARYLNQTIAFRSLRDTRDDAFWPTTGSEFELTAGAVQSEFLGRTSWFQSYDASTNWYAVGKTGGTWIVSLGEAF